MTPSEIDELQPGDLVSYDSELDTLVSFGHSLGIVTSVYLGVNSTYITILWEGDPLHRVYALSQLAYPCWALLTRAEPSSAE